MYGFCVRIFELGINGFSLIKHEYFVFNAAVFGA